MEVEIISSECIKPSSPTPLHLKTYKLCLLDQFRGHVFAPRFFYYPLNPTGEYNIDQIVSERLHLLKQSLSETLVGFYPLAGKMTNKFSVDCNDEGIYFLEAATKVPLNEFLNQPEVNLINKFFPKDGNEQIRQVAGAHVAKVQVTSFACGGLVICACISHFFGDGGTFMLFMKSWAAAATSRNTLKEAVYDAATLFPPYDAYPRELNRNTQLARFRNTGRVVTRRFVFGAKAIADLKAKATSSSVQRPSRVEVVSSLLSKYIMAAMRKKSGSHKPTLLSHAVNLRRKARPPLSDHLVGNIIWHANVLCKDEEVELDGLVSQLREAISKLDGDFVESLQGDGGFHNFYKIVKDEDEVYADVKDGITFTSSCGFAFYDIDFGWGKPIWVSVSGFGRGSVISLSTSLIILMNTRLGYGVEAWVSLLEEYMNLVEIDDDLLEFATLDPSPMLE